MHNRLGRILIACVLFEPVQLHGKSALFRAAAPGAKQHTVNACALTADFQSARRRLTRQSCVSILTPHMSLQVRSWSMAAASAVMAQQQQHDPALTVADTCALLGTDFPTMREFGQQIGSCDPMFGSATQQQQARSSKLMAAGQYSSFSGDRAQQKLSVRSMQPESAAPGAQQLQAACKAEPASPVAGAGSWVPVSDWNGDAGPYDGFMGASLFGDACGECGDMDADYGIDADSWNAADEVCSAPVRLATRLLP